MPPQRQARELKRALAIQMRQQGYPYQQIGALLEVSKSFISKWQQLYRQQGIDALKLGYWGTQGYLNDAALASSDRMATAAPNLSDRRVSHSPRPHLSSRV